MVERSQAPTHPQAVEFAVMLATLTGLRTRELVNVDLFDIEQAPCCTGVASEKNLPVGRAEMNAACALRFEVICEPDGSVRLGRAVFRAALPDIGLTISKGALPSAEAVCRDSDETLSDLLDEWVSSPDWDRYSEKTKKQHLKSIKALKRDLDALLSDFETAAKYGELRNYQDANARRAATCDNIFNTLCCALKYGVLLGKLSHNVASGIPDIYKVGRRARIRWSSEEISQFVQAADDMDMPNVGDIVLLAALTGFRLQDLISVTYEHVQEWVIAKEALKRSRFGNRYFAIIPRSEDLDLLLERLASRPRNEGVDTLLVDANGDEWLEHQVDIMVRDVRQVCGIHYIDPNTGQREEKHLHDLRGTYATHLITTTMLSDEEIATVMAWSPRWVARIRRVYVDEIVRVNAFGERLQALV
jgi:integrase